MKKYNEMNYDELMTTLGESISGLSAYGPQTASEWNGTIRYDFANSGKRLTDKQIGWVIEALRKEGLVKSDDEGLYSVDLANKECIFASEKFKTLTEAKEWIDGNGCGFRAMISGPGIMLSEPRSNFYVSGEGEYQYQDGLGEWHKFNPFKFDQSKYVQAYNKEKYARIEVKCKPEIKEELMRKAKAAGFSSLSQYLIKKGLE